MISFRVPTRGHPTRWGYGVVGNIDGALWDLLGRMADPTSK